MSLAGTCARTDSTADRSANTISVHSAPRYFEVLDSLADVMPKSLAGWKPPLFIVLGGESTGKSSLLERITMFPLFPQARQGEEGREGPLHPNTCLNLTPMWHSAV
jgi:hypothetical protein